MMALTAEVVKGACPRRRDMGTSGSDQHDATLALHRLPREAADLTGRRSGHRNIEGVTGSISVSPTNVTTPWRRATHETQWRRGNGRTYPVPPERPGPSHPRR